MDETRSRLLSPSVHEDVVARHFATDPTTRQQVHDPVIGVLRDAMLAARLGAEKARRVADAIMANEMLTMAARHTKIKDESWRAVEGALRQIDSAMARANREIEEVGARTSAPPRPTDAATAMLASEVRARLAGMTPTARRKALDDAVAQGDDMVLGAVLNGPPMLSGLGGPAEMETLRARWRQKRHGADVDRLERIARAAEDLDRAGTLVIGYTSRLSDHNIVERAEASQRAVEVALRS